MCSGGIFAHAGRNVRRCLPLRVYSDVHNTHVCNPACVELLVSKQVSMVCRFLCAHMCRYSFARKSYHEDPAGQYTYDRMETMTDDEIALYWQSTVTQSTYDMIRSIHMIG